MKKLILVLSLTIGSSAFADHSLQDVILYNSHIAGQVEQIQARNHVVCDLEQSNQSYAIRAEVGHEATQWKQIALCFANQRDLQRANAGLARGTSIGFSGVSGVVGTLTVVYTGLGDQLVSISYQ